MEKKIFRFPLSRGGSQRNGPWQRPKGNTLPHFGSFSSERTPILAIDSATRIYHRAIYLGRKSFYRRHLSQSLNGTVTRRSRKGAYARGSWIEGCSPCCRSSVFSCGSQSTSMGAVLQSILSSPPSEVSISPSSISNVIPKSLFLPDRSLGRSGHACTRRGKRQYCQLYRSLARS